MSDKAVVVTIRCKPVEGDALVVDVWVEEGVVLMQHPAVWVGDYEEHHVVVEIAGKQRTISIGRVESELEMPSEGSEGQG